MINTFSVGISLLLFAYTTNFYLGLLFVTAGGFGTILQGSVIMTIVQRDTAAKFRGRIISIMAMAIFGMLPLGSLLVGYVAPFLGTANTICIQGILAVVITVVFYKYLLHKRQPQMLRKV